MLLARAALHFWEEPPLSGESGSGAVFFANCPLRCVYCQNREIALGHAGIEVSQTRLADICLELQAQGALNINFVTPTHYADQVRAVISDARGRGLTVPVVWNTSGYERPEMIRWLGDAVDVYLTDFKYFDEGISKKYSNAPDYRAVAFESLKAMVDAVGRHEYDTLASMPRMLKGVIVRHLVLPGSIEDSMCILELLFSTFGNDIAYSIMNQYTPVMAPGEVARFPELGSKVSSEDYEKVLDFADELGIEDYFWQDGPAAAESFIPDWDGTGIQ